MRFVVTFQFLESSQKLNKLRPLRIDLAPEISRMSQINGWITFSNEAGVGAELERHHRLYFNFKVGREQRADLH